MATLKCITTMEADTLVPEDRMVNTWHFSTTGDPLLQTADIALALTTAYDQVDQIISSQAVNATGHRHTFYDLADLQPRQPIDEVPFDFVALGSGLALPSEVACCLSFQGDRISGQPQARRRGRVYLPPFITTTLSVGRISSAALTAVAAMGQSLLDASQAATGWDWIVRSETGLEINRNVVVTNGWVDNAWDIQRRRGWDATTRTLFS